MEKTRTAMATTVKAAPKGGSSLVKTPRRAKGGGEPRSLKISERGIRTGHDFANMMSALMSDIISGRVTPNVGNATCNAGGKLLKVVEMQYKYGTNGSGGGKKTLVLALESGGETSAA